LIHRTAHVVVGVVVLFGICGCTVRRQVEVVHGLMAFRFRCRLRRLKNTPNRGFRNNVGGTHFIYCSSFFSSCIWDNRGAAGRTIIVL
jgi:hypothetical protein